MAPRKFVRVSMIIDHTKVYDVLELAENNALAGSLEIAPVRHGGEKESGELTPAPTAETFLNDYLAKHERIDTKEVIPLADKVGITRNSVYAQIKRMTDRKQIKRIDVGAYVLRHRAGRPPPPAKEATAKTRRKAKAKPNDGKSAVDRLVALVASKQNGSKGVMLADLKTEMELDGYVPTGVGPALTSLVAKGRLVRVGKGEYRTPPSQEHQPTPEASAVVEG
jgi:hypothetical protein